MQDSRDSSSRDSAHKSTLPAPGDETTVREYVALLAPIRSNAAAVSAAIWGLVIGEAS